MGVAAPEMRMKAVILNSRQGARPVGSDGWICNTLAAVKDAVSHGYCLLTSVGMNSWELVLYLASKHRMPQKILLPLGRNNSINAAQEYYTRQFQLDKALVEWDFISTEKSQKDDHLFQQMRDKKVIEEFDVIYPISIRPDGNLGYLIKSARSSGRKLNDDFQTGYSGNPRVSKMIIDYEKLDFRINQEFDNWVIHWTKTSNGPWPGETMFDFYEAIINSSEEYPRSGLDTLIRILSEKRLRASSRHYRKDFRGVAFSSLIPVDAARLMRWRARYHEMTFEPYGLAISQGASQKIGIKKVFYGNPEMFGYLEEENGPYFQSIGTKGYWIPEKEHRHIGDVDLSAIPQDDIIVIVWKKKEIEKVSSVFNGRIISLSS
jgi:hypothetical protein